MSAGEIITLVYLVGAVVCAVITWIENTKVYYVFGPPSGCLTGLFWPLILLVVVLEWLFDPMRKNK